VVKSEEYVRRSERGGRERGRIDGFVKQDVGLGFEDGREGGIASMAV